MDEAVPTGAERYLRERLVDPEFARAYHEARDGIAVVDRLVYGLDAVGVVIGACWSELVRRVLAAPEVVHQLLEGSDDDSTLRTLGGVADALELDVGLLPRPGLGTEW